MQTPETAAVHQKQRYWQIIVVQTDLLIQELQEQLQKAESELTIMKEKLKKSGKNKGLQYGDLKTDKEVNLLTGIPTRACSI